MKWDLPRRGLADGLQPDVNFSRYKYLLVMKHIFTGWIKGFATWIEKAEEVVKKQKQKTAP